MSRPTLDDQTVRENYIAELRSGMRRGAAAEFLQMRRFEVYAYIAEHPAFEREVLEAEDAALENVEEALYQAAITGNVRAAELWLNRMGGQRRPALSPIPPDSGDLQSRLEQLGG